MKITNKNNLPEPLVGACAWHAPVKDRYSVTELVGPPMVARLRREHWDEIEEDVSDRLWAIMGSAMHGVLAEHGTPNSLTEEKLVIKRTVDGREITIAGKPDTYDENGIISDWKFTSVYMHGEEVKPEWRNQLNMYALMIEEHGFLVNGLQIVTIYRDWSRRHAEQGVPHAEVIPIMLVDKGQQAEYLDKRLKVHMAETPAPCTPDERWARPDTWAVMKKGKKSALRVLKSEAEAEAWMKNKSGDNIEYRVGEDIRCQGYCPVKQFCEYGRTK